MPNTIPVAVLTNETGAHLDAYFPALAQTEEASAVYLSDPSGTKVALARKVLGDKLQGVFQSPRELLQKVRPQMALVTMEAVAAPPVIDQALDAGCHVFAEKPSCVRAEDFEKLVRKAQQNHRHLMLALANRLHAPVQEARRLIQKGALGNIYGMEFHIIADQTRLKRPEYRKAWYAQRARAGGGHLIWLGIHWLDVALFMTGLRVSKVAGFAGVVGGQPLDVEDSAAVALTFSNGSFGTLTSGYYLDRGYHSHVQVWGEHGWLKLAAIEDEPLQWYSTRDNPKATVQRFEYQRGLRGYTPLVRAAVRASAGLQEPPITGEECLHVLKAIFAFYQAARDGRVVEVR